MGVGSMALFNYRESRVATLNKESSLDFSNAGCVSAFRMISR
jgi:hypothetical protein